MKFLTVFVCVLGLAIEANGAVRSVQERLWGWAVTYTALSALLAAILWCAVWGL